MDSTEKQNQLASARGLSLDFALKFRVMNQPILTVEKLWLSPALNAK
jgi:hypothetical protein